MRNVDLDKLFYLFLDFATGADIDGIFVSVALRARGDGRCSRGTVEFDLTMSCDTKKSENQ